MFLHWQEDGNNLIGYFYLAGTDKVLFRVLIYKEKNFFRGAITTADPNIYIYKTNTTYNTREACIIYITKTLVDTFSYTLTSIHDSLKDLNKL